MSDDQPGAPKAPAGWYGDGGNGQRYWDGNSWTDPRAPVAPERVRVNGVGVAAFVVGLVAVLLAFLPALGVVSFLVSVVGVGLGIAGIAIAIKVTHSGMAFACLGTIAGGIAVVGALSIH